MASSSRATGLFTVDYVVSIGGTDDHESREMIHMLNLLTSFWGNEAIGYMEKFLNLVKSKTDELSTTLQSQGPAVRHETSGVAEPKKIRVLELEKKEILLRLKESEDKVESLQHTLKNAQEKYTELEKQTRVPKEKGILNMFAASYTKKCIELDNLRDEAVRHSIWFNEQTNASMAAKLDLEKNLSMKENRIKELQTHKIEESEEKSPTNGVDDLLKGFLMPPDSTNMNCLIPTHNGGLVSLDTVYMSWKKHVDNHQDLSFPSFKIRSSKDQYILANGLQIRQMCNILSKMGYNYKLPFMIQFKMKAEESVWSDLNISDQMTAAYIMYYMRLNQKEPAEKMTERRMVQDDELLLTLSLNENGEFEIDLRVTEHEPMEIIPSQLIVGYKDLAP